MARADTWRLYLLISRLVGSHTGRTPTMDTPALLSVAARTWICRDCDQASSPLIDGVCVPCRDAEVDPRTQHIEPRTG